MGSRIVKACTKAGIAAAFVLSAGIASAQQSSENQVNAVTDWSVFTESDPKECWAVSTAKETVNTKDGRVVAVRRSSILLMVVFRPGDNVAGQVGLPAATLSPRARPWS